MEGIHCPFSTTTTTTAAAAAERKIISFLWIHHYAKEERSLAELLKHAKDLVLKLLQCILMLTQMQNM
jgi:hypothetical protein